MVDSPDGGRKLQARAVPVGGGVAVFLAALATLAVAAAVSPAVADALAADARRSVALLAAAALIVGVGLVDDYYNLRARYKFGGQLAAALILVYPGDFVIGQIGVFGWLVELGPLSVPVTLFWLLACVNALNLLDGMDGMLGTVGLIALVTVAVMAAMLGHTFTAVVALALAGAVLGFLRYNLPPASIYMGDSGSMLLGLVIGALAIPAALKGPATVSLCAPVALVVLPMIDTTAAVIRRKLTGRGLATADRGHLHHVLLRNGWTIRRVLVIVAGFALIASGGALATTALNNDVFALVAVAGVVVSLVATRLFGNAECSLVKSRVVAATRGLRGGRAWELAVSLQGSRDWNEVWQEVVECAARLDLHSVCLDVNAPALHENYHARWDQAAGGGEGFGWQFEMPLMGGGQLIGRLAVSGSRNNECISEMMRAVGQIIESAEARIAEVSVQPTRPGPDGTLRAAVV